MREILFRGKAKTIKRGEWIEGSLVNTYDWYTREQHCFIVDDDFQDHDEWEVDPETVGQYTGLIDKNGKRIFEGDVIENRDDEGCYTNFVIEWIDQEAGFFARYIDKKYGENILNLGDYKVIGNIHDSPELLEAL